MSDRIEQAAKIIGGHVDHYIGIEPDQPLDAARALAEAGLLATRAEYAEAWDEGYQAGVHDERIAAGWDYPATPGRANPYKEQP